MYKIGTLISIFFMMTTISHADMLIAYAKEGYKPTPARKIEIDKIQVIAKKMNVSVTFKAIPWKRALIMLEKGLIDGLINASYKENRAKYALYPLNKQKIDFSKRLNNGNSYFIYKNRNSKLKWDGKKFTSPDGNIAVRERYAVIKDLKKHNNIIIEEFAMGIEIVRSLLNGQNVAFATTQKDIENLQKKYPFFTRTIKKEPIPIRQEPYFLVFSKKTYKNKHLEMEKIWTEIKALNE